MRNLAPLLLCFTLVACSSGYYFALREKPDKPSLPVEFAPVERDELPALPPNLRVREATRLYSSESERVEVVGKTSGLNRNIRRVYLSLFTDFTEKTNFSRILPEGVTIQNEFDRLLKLELQKYGLQPVKTLNSAQAVIDGSILSFDIIDALPVIRQEGLIYSMRVEYSWDDKLNMVSEERKTVEERILVVDPLNYPTNSVIFTMLEQTSRRTAEALIYGWQLEYSGKDGKYLMLGETNEVDNLTNG